MTFATEIEAEAEGKEIIAIVVGKYRGSSFQDKSPFSDPNRVHQWKDVREFLDYDYDAGYGGEDCHSITAWTEDLIIFVSCYDGATWVSSVPRNPVDHEPTMFGGG